MTAPLTIPRDLLSSRHVISVHLDERAAPRCAFSIIVPAYNEQLALESAVERIIGLLAGETDYEIVIIEDGCTDWTPVVAADLRQRYPQVRHVHSRVRLGKGRAVSEGMRLARGEAVILMDADMATDPGDVLAFVRAVREGRTDIVIGSRYHPESRTTRTPMRLAYSRAYNAIVRVLLGSRIRDHQCGFKVFNGDAIKSILPFVKSDRFFWDTEVLVVASRLGYDVREVPISWKEGTASKVRAFRTPIEMFVGIVGLWLTRRWRLP